MATALQLERTQPLWFIDNLVPVHIDGDTSGGSFALLEMCGGRGDMPPLHVHERDDETFYVLDGELSLFVAGQQLILGAGQAALAPRAVPHCYPVESEQARWLLITTPAGLDSVVREGAEPAPPPPSPRWPGRCRGRPRPTRSRRPGARRTRPSSPGPPPRSASRSSAL